MLIIARIYGHYVTDDKIIMANTVKLNRYGYSLAGFNALFFNEIWNHLFICSNIAEQQSRHSKWAAATVIYL